MELRCWREMPKFGNCIKLAFKGVKANVLRVSEGE
jgi:hypothetical protein